jgi:putative ABC transport system ATP-binding protein
VASALVPTVEGIVHVVLGVSMAPTTVRVVLVGGENADGDIVDQDKFDATTDDDAPTVTAPDHVISAILGAREDAAADGDLVTSTGVAWADPADAADAATLRERLAVRKIENVMLVSALSAAAAVARAFGSAAHYAHTALLYIEPDSATLAVVNTADGSVAALRQRSLPDDDDAAVAGLVEMVKGADEMEPRPEGVFLVGSGVDIPLIKPALEAAASLSVRAPEEPQRALARGAALVSVRAPFFAPSTAALARAFGSAAHYAHTALLYVEPDSATLAVVKTSGGSVAFVRQRFLPDDDDAALAALVEMVKGADEMDPRPEAVFVVGSGVDVPLIKPALEAATSLPVGAAEDQQKAPARVSANAPRLHGPAVLEARNLCKSFGREPTTTPILKNIDLQIFPGEFVALIGPSGSGKSTLLSILGLLEPPTSGDVLVNQRSVAHLSGQELAAVRGRRIGYVFQSFNLLGGLSVAENVMLPSLLAGESGHAQYNRAFALLDQFGLAAFAKRVPAELSGGEQQRVAIARALFMAPDVILADEPTGNLDTKNGHIVIDTLYRLNAAGQTIVLVTHDLSIANEAPRLISLLDGRIETDTGPLQRSRNAAWRPSR